MKVTFASPRRKRWPGNNGRTAKFQTSAPSRSIAARIGTSSDPRIAGMNDDRCTRSLENGGQLADVVSVRVTQNDEIESTGWNEFANCIRAAGLPSASVIQHRVSTGHD